MSSKEKFTKGYNYLIDNCIQKCELMLLQNDPYYVQLQEGGYMAQSFCENRCAAEYNRQTNGASCGFPSNGACMVRKPSYKKCPLTFSRYKLHPHSDFVLNRFYS